MKRLVDELRDSVHANAPSEFYLSLANRLEEEIHALEERKAGEYIEELAEQDE